MLAIYQTMGGFKGNAHKLMPLPSDRATPGNSEEEHLDWVKQMEEKLKFGRTKQVPIDLNKL